MTLLQKKKSVRQLVLNYKKLMDAANDAGVDVSEALDTIAEAIEELEGDIMKADRKYRSVFL